MNYLIRLLVVDDHQIVRCGLAAFLTARNGMQVVGEAATGEEAIVKARYLNPDVILMDLNMPGMGGLEATRMICAEKPDARILILTSFDEDNRVPAAIQAGALGYLRKDTSADELFNAIHNIARGASYLSQEIVQKLVHGLHGSKGNSRDGNALTERELDVLAALAKGLSNQEIADLLIISCTTVRSHVRNVLGKLGVSNRTEAAIYAVESGVLYHRA
jgi:NarL family two-component system response regulator LiaR